MTFDNVVLKILGTYPLYAVYRFGMMVTLLSLTVKGQLRPASPALDCQSEESLIPPKTLNTAYKEVGVMNITAFIFIVTFILFPEYYFLVWYGMFALIKALITAMEDVFKS